MVAVSAPSTISAGDTLLAIVTGEGEGQLSVSGGPVSWTGGVTFQSDSATVRLFEAHVPTAELAVGMRRSEIVADITPAGEGARGGNLIVLRATGADPLHLVESSTFAENDLAIDGTMTFASMDPTHRHDNVMLYVVASLWGQDSPQPTPSVARSAPLRTETLPPGSSQDEGAAGLSTMLAHRPLDSDGPTSPATVAFGVAPSGAQATAYMLRSENQPPEISLPEEWAAEVGRNITISATVTDPDRTPVSFAWTWVSGPEEVQIQNVYSRSFLFTPLVPGVHIFELTATDVDGGRAQMRTRVVVPTGLESPSSVVESAGWTDQSGGTVTAPLFGDGDDGTFAKTVDLPIGEPLVLALPPIYGGAAISISIRGAATNPSPVLQRTVTLSQADGLVIAERSYPLPTTMTSYTFTTSKAETALIADRATLRVTIVDEVA